MAVCVAGQYRTHSYTQESLLKYVVGPLSRVFQTDVDVFYVLSESDRHRTLLPNKGVVYKDIDASRSVRSQQFLRFEECRQLIQASGRSYPLAIRTRPDLLFVRPLPNVSMFDTHLLAKLRCFNANVYQSIHIHQLSQELQHSRTCRLSTCGPTSTRIDDQFAIVPTRFIDAYFASHHKRTWLTNRSFEEPGFPVYIPGNNVYTLTRSFVDLGELFKPLNYPFCIQRDAHKCFVAEDRIIRC